MSTLRAAVYRRLQHHFHFFSWHTTPYELRPYAKWMTWKLSRMMEDGRCEVGDVVEIGCGLGDIISNIRGRGRRMGYDIDEKVIRAAKIVHPLTKFHVGSFRDIQGKKFSVVIAVNFLHFIPPAQVQAELTLFLKCNNVSMLVIDHVQAPPYEYSHDFDAMLESAGYRRIYSSRGFEAVNGSRRYIWFYRKTLEHTMEADEFCFSK